MRLTLGVVFVVAGACASPRVESAGTNVGPTTTNGGAAPSPEAVQASDASQVVERHPALAPLRPVGSAEVLLPLEHDPGPAAYAAAASFYSATDTRGMALLWGLTYGALAFDGQHRQHVAASMIRALREGIVRHDDGVSVHFAPGEMPVIRQTDGAIGAPVAHLYEEYFSSAFVMVESSEWPPSEIYTTMSGYLPHRPTPLDELLMIHVWLRALCDAGHMHGFVAHVFDIATPMDEETVSDAREWIAEHPFTAPARGIAPDDLASLE